MSNMSFRLSRAMSAGRARNGAPATRAEVLSRLLRKRAAAHQAGLKEQEQALRNQIKWALPIQRPEERTQKEGAPV